MKNISRCVRIYDVEQIRKINKLVEIGYGKTINEVVNKTNLVGIDIVYEKIVEQKKNSSFYIEEQMGELSNKLTEYSRLLMEKSKEQLSIEYVNQLLISSIHNILINYIKFGTIDVEQIEKGLYDILPERFSNLIYEINKSNEE